MISDAKSFNIFATSLSVLHNYFDGLIKLLDLYLHGKNDFAERF